LLPTGDLFAVMRSAASSAGRFVRGLRQHPLAWPTDTEWLGLSGRELEDVKAKASPLRSTTRGLASANAA